MSVRVGSHSEKEGGWKRKEPNHAVSTFIMGAAQRPLQKIVATGSVQSRRGATQVYRTTTPTAKRKLNVNRRKRRAVITGGSTVTETAEGDLLSNWGNMLRVDRTYYGDDKNVKPNEYCFWSEYAYVVGWYETDDSLRKRVLGSITRETAHEAAKGVTMPTWATHIAVDTVGSDRPKPCALDGGLYITRDPNRLKVGDWVDILAKYRWEFFSRADLEKES